MKRYRLLQDLTFVGYKLFSKGQIVYEIPGYWHPDKVKIGTRRTDVDFGCQTLVPRELVERIEDET